MTTHVIVEGIKVGHLVHVAGAFVGACVAWVILLALEAYRVRGSGLAAALMKAQAVLCLWISPARG